MSVRPPDDLDMDVLDIDELELGAPGPARTPRTPPAGSTPKARPVSDPNNGSWTDPRFLVPLLLFLSAVFVIGMAIRSGSLDGGDQPEIQVQSELALAVRDAELRAGFDGLTITENDGSVIIEGQARDPMAAASIGAVARSVDGTQRVDNRVIVEGGALEASTPTPTVIAVPDGLDQQLASVGQITFETGSVALTAEGAAIIDTVASLLQSAPGILVEVHGHTDSDGDDVKNQILSQDRAEAVVVALAQRGVEQTRLTAVGFGESKPLEPNITEEGRSTNRRIEFLVVS